LFLVNKSVHLICCLTNACYLRPPEDLLPDEERLMPPDDRLGDEDRKLDPDDRLGDEDRKLDPEDDLVPE
jgi:hypothetical protein